MCVGFTCLAAMGTLPFSSSTYPPASNSSMAGSAARTPGCQAAFARRAEVATPRWPKISRSAPPDGEFELSRCREMNKPHEKLLRQK